MHKSQSQKRFQLERSDQNNVCVMYILDLYLSFSNQSRAGVAQRYCNGLQRDGPGERCKNRALIYVLRRHRDIEMPSQNDLAVDGT